VGQGKGGDKEKKGGGLEEKKRSVHQSCISR